MSRGTIKDQLQAAQFHAKAVSSGGTPSLEKRVTPVTRPLQQETHRPPIRPLAESSHPLVVKTPDQDIADAKAQITAAESKVRAAAWALKDAQREVSLAENKLHMLLA